MGLDSEQLSLQLIGIGIGIGCLCNAPNTAGLSIVAKVIFSIVKVDVSILLVCVFCVLPDCFVVQLQYRLLCNVQTYVSSIVV